MRWDTAMVSWEALSKTSCSRRGLLGPYDTERLCGNSAPFSGPHAGGLSALAISQATFLSQCISYLKPQLNNIFHHVAQTLLSC